MIIVSQDKVGIINFDNINTLMATKTGRIVSFDNTYKSEDDYSDVLGIYETEERAKEVLQEIITAYTGDAMYEYNGYRSFEMPKE